MYNCIVIFAWKHMEYNGYLSIIRVKSSQLLRINIFTINIYIHMITFWLVNIKLFYWILYKIFIYYLTANVYALNVSEVIVLYALPCIKLKNFLRLAMQNNTHPSVVNYKNVSTINRQWNSHSYWEATNFALSMPIPLLLK